MPKVYSSLGKSQVGTLTRTQCHKGLGRRGSVHMVTTLCITRQESVQMCVHLPPLIQRARDLFYALWVPDLFMRRVKSNEDWSLMCPNECPGLADTWGEEFERLYEQYEKEGRAKKVVKAQKLWFAILEAQTETGTPYMLYKDACNRKSNQQVLKFIPGCDDISPYRVQIHIELSPLYFWLGESRVTSFQVLSLPLWGLLL